MFYDCYDFMVIVALVEFSSLFQPIKITRVMLSLWIGWLFRVRVLKKYIEKVLRIFEIISLGSSLVNCILQKGNEVKHGIRMLSIFTKTKNIFIL
jgi:hypothetical protein